MTNVSWMTTWLTAEMKHALFTLCWLGLATMGANVDNPEPDFATLDQYFYGRELIDCGKTKEEEQERHEEEPEKGIEMVDLDDDNYVTIRKPTMYESVHCQLHRNRCPICFEEPASEKVSVVVLPCSHMICGSCLYRSIETAMEDTGVLNCPLCILQFES
jgi:hypothetical protein